MQETYRREMENISLEKEKLAGIVDAMVQSGRKESVRPGFGRKLAVLVAAAALMVIAMGAGVAVMQGRMTFFTDKEAAESVGASQGYFDHLAENPDYPEEDLLRHIEGLVSKPSSAESWHEDFTYVQGSPEDGWTRLATGLMEDGARDTWYQGDRLSDLSGLWDTGLDLSWLETHYRAEAGAHYVLTRVPAGAQSPDYTEAAGQYRGGGDRIVKLFCQYWADGEEPHDFAELTEYYEYYETRDGVTVPFEMHRSETGKTLFTASLELTGIRFSLTGTQLETEEIHALLDSLHLSNLLK